MLSLVIDILCLTVALALWVLAVALWVLFGLAVWLFWVALDSARTDRLCERIEQRRFPFL